VWRWLHLLAAELMLEIQSHLHQDRVKGGHLTAVFGLPALF
jgi:hypothetical protein